MACPNFKNEPKIGLRPLGVKNNENKMEHSTINLFNMIQNSNGRHKRWHCDGSLQLLLWR
jgi:hypothetical protein